MAHGPLHGPEYAGLAGGAVEVFIRSVGWASAVGPPRPLPFMEPLPAALPAAQITVIVPVLSVGLARAVRDDFVAGVSGSCLRRSKRGDSSDRRLSVA